MGGSTNGRTVPAVSFQAVERVEQVVLDDVLGDRLVLPLHRDLGAALGILLVGDVMVGAGALAEVDVAGAQLRGHQHRVAGLDLAAKRPHLSGVVGTPRRQVVGVRRIEQRADVLARCRPGEVVDVPADRRGARIEVGLLLLTVSAGS